jgi:hypothetical protein
MSIQAVAWALEQDLPARPKLVLVAICNHANHTDGYCWLKAETIGREASCTPRSVYTFIGGLVRNGFIRKALRKGEDGKQRANDYWVLFEREEQEWDWGANPEAPEAEHHVEENAPGPNPAENALVPHEGNSSGPDERHDTPQPVEKHDPSPGPSEAGFTRYESLEPSKPKPKASSASGARLGSAPPRSYRAPPPPPQGADTEVKTKPVFVYHGSRAWEAWSAFECKRKGIRSWTLTTRALIDGKWRIGWYWPTLFPPRDDAAGPEPPRSSDPQFSPEDAQAMMK